MYNFLMHFIFLESVQEWHIFCGSGSWFFSQPAAPAPAPQPWYIVLKIRIKLIWIRIQEASNIKWTQNTYLIHIILRISWKSYFKLPVCTKDRYIVSIERVYTPSTFNMKLAVHIWNVQKIIFYNLADFLNSIYPLLYSDSELRLKKDTDPENLSENISHIIFIYFRKESLRRVSPLGFSNLKKKKYFIRKTNCVVCKWSENILIAILKKK